MRADAFAPNVTTQTVPCQNGSSSVMTTDSSTFTSLPQSNKKNNSTMLEQQSDRGSQARKRPCSQKKTIHNIVLISAATVLLAHSVSPVTGLLPSGRPISHSRAWAPAADNKLLNSRHRHYSSRFLPSDNNFLMRLQSEPKDDGRSSSSAQSRESRFTVRRRVKSALAKSPIFQNRKSFQLSAELDSEGWSKATTESRLGVRRRVRSVLERAKNRTGIRNNSEYLDDSNGRRALKTTASVSSVVADAAAIGGLGAVVVDEVSGKIDVAFDYNPPEKEEDTKSTQIKVNGTATKSPKPVSPVKKRKKKTNPASTYSKPVYSKVKSDFEEQLTPVKSKAEVRKTRSVPEIDAFRGDSVAAFSMPPPPLPFTLPKLSPEQERQIENGERVQFQTDMGREGSGFVVLDVKAPSDVVWETLLDFYSYPQTIPTVRDIQMFTNTHLAQNIYSEEKVDQKEYNDGTLATLKHGVPSVTRASFSLSKFRLKIAAIHKYRPHPLGDYMIFTLDPACTNAVLKNAKGVWHTQSNPDGREVRFYMPHIFLRVVRTSSFI